MHIVRTPFLSPLNLSYYRFKTGFTIGMFLLDNIIKRQNKITRIKRFHSVKIQKLKYPRGSGI